MVRELVVAFCFIWFSAPAVFAWVLPENDSSNDNFPKEFFIINSVKITDISGEKNLGLSVPPPLNDDLGSIITKLEALVATGDKIMTLVKKGRPVLNTDFQPIRVLPKIEGETLADTFYQMHNWSAPTSRTYRIEFENLLGVRVVVFEYSIHYQSNGQFNSKGRYLSGVKVVPNNVNVSYGFQLDAQSSLLEVTNIGESSDAPVAGISLEVSYRAKSIMKEHLGGATYFISGDGQFKELSL